MYYNYLLSYGVIRIVLIVVLLTFLNSKITNKTINRKLFENYVFMLITYGSCLIILIYLLSILNVYDVVSSYLIIAVFFLLHYFKQKKARKL